MRASRQSPFVTVRSEGAILPPDLLQAVARGDGQLEGLRSEDYHLAAGEKLNEAISRSWNRLLGVWTAFQDTLAKVPETDTATSTTRERWLLILFQELGYGRLVTSKAVQIEGRSYPVSHSWQNSPIHLVGWNIDLDRRTAGVAGAARTSPHSLVQEFLNRSDDHLWGFVSNGQRLRILRDNVTLTRQAYVEFDLESMMQGEAYSDFVVLWLVCHESRVEAERPEQCWLEKWSQSAQERGTRALEKLRGGVEEAINALGRGFLSHPANGTLREKLRAGELSTQDYYRQLLRMIYRLLFLFVAEDRNLLLRPDAVPEAMERYEQYYSTARLRRLAEKRKGTQHPDLWRGLRLVMEKLGSDEGCPELGLPALGSFLWSKDAVADLAECDIANRDLLDAVRALSFTVEGKVRRNVDYKNMGSEELGSVYESLLELHPELNVDTGSFSLATASGHERRTTGSYYTPSSLVNCLLDSALDPVLEEAAGEDNPKEAILNLKVCDPACGSGHFLVTAAHRIAKRLAGIRTGDEEPSPEATRTALRDVIGHCMYGVDLNPMAVELCKVSLWMEALEPGKPLSFLDHHIQCGNSLFGTTPALLESGIPDDAFKPIEGDDREYCKDYKKRNKQERTGQQSLFYGKGMPWEQLGNLPAAIMNIDTIQDDTVEGVRRKQERYENLVKSSGYLFGRLLADAWCAAFVWKKRKDDTLAYPITEEIFQRIKQTPHSCPGWMKEEIQRLAEQYQFFHWHLAFANVFRVPTAGEEPENDTTGWSGGFDVALGNPPWEKVELLEKEWFAISRPDIAMASTGAKRKRMIAELVHEDPLLYSKYRQAAREYDGMRSFIRNGGRYPLCSTGRINTYAAFTETYRALLSSEGYVGCVVPSGIATDDSTKLFFQRILRQQELVSFYDFENRRGIFPAVQGNMKFCLLTLSSSSHPAFLVAAQLDDPVGLSDSSLRCSMTIDDIQRINPNTLNCPTFRTSQDAEIIKRIYSKVDVLIREERADHNPWGIRFKQGLFNMTSDSHLFSTREQLERDGWLLRGNTFVRDRDLMLPLYEAKFASQFNHRAATFDGIPETDRFRIHAGTNPVTQSAVEDPLFQVIPRYWVPESAVRSQHANRCRWFLGFRNAISAVADSRSLVAVILPYAGIGNSMPLLLFSGPSWEPPILLGILNSFVVDYVLRQKASGGNLNFYVFKQLAVISPEALEKTSWLSDRAIPDWMRSRVVELSYTAWDVEPFAKDCGYDSPPFQWDEERRFLLRCELDAACFHLYLGNLEEWRADGSQDLLQCFPTPRDSVDHIMETFPIVKRRDIQEHGTYRTKDTILQIYDAMQHAIDTGEPYQTLLDPPPADPRVAHPPREREGDI